MSKWEKKKVPAIVSEMEENSTGIATAKLLMCKRHLKLSTIWKRLQRDSEIAEIRYHLCSMG